MAREQLSTLEMTLLGMAWLRGPCTVYTVMKELSLSESTFYRSRAGTAYSVTKRLVERRLLTRTEDDMVEVTSEGEAVLRDWTGPDVPMKDVAHSADLLRLRCFFLEVLPPSARLEFVDRSLAQLREFSQRCEGLIAQNQEIGDYFGALATGCLVLETRARIHWLERIRPLVENPLSPDADWSAAILASLGD